MGYMYNALNLASKKSKLTSYEVPEEDTFAIQGRQSELKLPQEIAREFSMLKMQLKQAYADNGTKLIAITSAVPGEGKSTISYVLSRMLIQSTNGYTSPEDTGASRGHGVLLIDGNLEKPVMHNLFNISPVPGLTDFVSHNSEKRIYMHCVSGNALNLITVGGQREDRQDLWGMGKISKLFNKLKEHFDYILIDTPPVINHPETIALCKLVDGVLLVIKANNTRLEVVKEAKEQLEEADVKILGAVLNRRLYYIPKLIYKTI